MATFTIRNVPEEAKQRFRQAAAAHGRSMEEHLRQLIVDAGAETASAVRDTRSTFGHRPEDSRAESRVRAESRARIERLIALGRGLETFEVPPREVGTIKDLDLS